MTARLLIVEDTPSMARLYREYLSDVPVTVEHVETVADAKAALASTPPDLILLDLQLPDGDGLEVLEDCRQRNLAIQSVVVTARGSVTTAVDAMRAGAYDFIVKPCSGDRLRVTVRNALEKLQLTRAMNELAPAPGGQFCGFVGASFAMQAVYRAISTAARSRATVFITGESGTGKEVCAEAIHMLSPRRKSAFIALNCGAIPADLIESELFGHVRGAFTGATSDREGAVARANGGTLFLDEICEMDLALQVKLLRVLQSGSFQKVGGSRLETVDTRILCATNRDPWAEVQAGRFREDLYYRLYVVPITLPPLRERDQDALLIARHFLKTYNEEEGKHFIDFDETASQMILQFNWPGNVRQLQNVVRQAVVLHDADQVSATMLSIPNLAGSVAANGASSARPADSGSGTVFEDGVIRPLWMLERDAIERAIELCSGNIAKAAAMLDVSPSTLYRKRQAWATEA